MMTALTFLSSWAFFRRARRSLRATDCSVENGKASSVGVSVTAPERRKTATVGLAASFVEDSEGFDSLEVWATELLASNVANTADANRLNRRVFMGAP